VTELQARAFRGIGQALVKTIAIRFGFYPSPLYRNLPEFSGREASPESPAVYA
jgi:hypothetical protein